MDERRDFFRYGLPAPPEHLRQAQRWLAGVILNPETLDAHAAVARIRQPDAESAATRLGAYTGGYPARIEESLADAYPAVRHLLGTGRFRELARRYLPLVPKGCYNLNAIGGTLADLLDADPLSAELPFLADLARLEWAVWNAFHAPPAPPLDVSELTEWTAEDWATATIDFAPGVSVIRSRWPIADLWAARSTPKERIDIVLEGRPQTVLVSRRGYDVECTPISELEARAIEALGDGRILIAVTAELAAAGAQPDQVEAWFAGWSERGIVARCTRSA